MPYGTIKVDNITFTDNSVDKTVSLSGLIQNPTFTGNVTVTGTISGDVIRGGTTISGVTVTGTTANFVSGVFTTRISGATITGTTVAATTGNYTSLTGVTTTGTTANFVSGVFTTQISGATITGTTVATTTGSFVSLTGTTATFTSGIIASGTAALPSLAILSDPNTGIYSPGADELAISTGGSGRLFVDASGNVGLGITPVANTLIGGARGSSLPGLIELAGNGNTVGSSGFAIGQDSSGVGVLFQRANAAMYFATNGTERLRITSAGLVGVGTSSPSTNLDIVVGSGTATQKLGSSSVAGGSYLNLHGASASKTWFIGANYNVAGVLEFTQSTANGGTTPSATPAMVLSAAGLVGIGTAAPGSKLTIQQAANTISEGLLLVALSGSVNGGWYHNGSALVGREGGFDTINLAAGKVGIGTTGPSEKLHVIGNIQVGDSGNERGIYVGAAGFSGAFLYQSSGDVQLSPRSGYGIKFAPAPGSATEWGRWDSSGRLLVGTSSALSSGVDSQYAKLLIVGNAYAASDHGTLALARGEAAASITSGEAIGFITFSDNAGKTFADISCIADANAGAVSDFPGRLVFSTTPDGGSSPTSSPPAMTIKSSQEVLIGTSTITANGGVLQLKSGITFPATAVAASNANTLDDYEEGTWTGTDGSGAGLSITFVDGRYTKIGRIVYVNAGYITYPVTASTANATIGGLPFTNGADNAGVTALVSANVNANRALVVASTATAFFYSTSTTTQSTNAQLSNTIIYGFSAVYQV